MIDAAEAAHKLSEELKNIKNLKDFNEFLKNQAKNSENAKKALTAHEKAVKALEAAKKRLKVAEQSEAVETAKLRVETAELNKKYKLQAREALGLIGAYERLSKELTENRNKFKNAAAQYGLNSSQAEKYREKVQALDKSLKEIDATAGQHQRKVGEYERGTVEVVKALKSQERELKENLEILKKAAQSTDTNSKSQDKFQKELKETEQKLNKVQAELKEYGATSTKANKSNVNLAGSFANIAKNLVGAFGVVGGMMLFAQVVKSGFNKIKEFDSAQSELAGILGTNKKNISDLTNLTLKLGSSTAYTATESTKAATELAKLGFTQNQIKDSLEGTLDAAIAFGVELPDAARLVASTLKAFNLEASETDRVVSTLAVSTTKSALDFSKLETALANVAPAAAAANYSIEQITALLGLVVDKGVDASTAGTMLRNIFIELSKSGMTLEEAMSQIAGSQDKLSTATELFGKRAAVTAIALADSKDRVNELTDAITGQDAALKTLVDERLDNLKGDLTLLDSAWEGLILSIEKGDGALANFTRSVIQGTTELLGFLTVQEKQADALRDERAELLSLTAQLQSTLIPEEQRNKIKSDLIAKYPKYLSFLEDEKYSNEELRDALSEINGLYLKRIRIAQGNDEIIEAEQKYNETVQEQQSVLSDYISLIQRTADAKNIDTTGVDWSKPIKGVGGVINQLQKLYKEQGVSQKAINDLGHVLQMHGNKYDALTGRVEEYGSELGELRNKQSNNIERETKSEATILKTKIAYEDATSAILAYKNNQLLLSDTYKQLTGNTTATKEELEAFKNLVETPTKSALDNFINQLALVNVSQSENRESLSGLAYMNSQYEEAVNNLKKSLDGQNISTETLQKSIKDLTAEQINNKSSLIKQITEVNKNVSANDLLIKSLETLRAMYKETGEAAKSDFADGTIGSLQETIQKLNTEKLSATGENLIKINKEIAQYQSRLNKLQNQGVEKPTNTPRRTQKGSEAKTKAQEAIKAQQEELNHFILVESIKIDTMKEATSYYNDRQEKQLNILDKRLKSRLISEQAYQTEKIKIQRKTDEDIEAYQVELYDRDIDNAERKLKTFEMVNKSILESEDFLTESIIANENDRLQNIADLQIAAITSRYDKEIELAKENVDLIADLEKQKAAEIININKEVDKQIAANKKSLLDDSLEYQEKTLAIELINKIANGENKEEAEESYQERILGMKIAAIEQQYGLNEAEIENKLEQFETLSDLELEYLDLIAERRLEQQEKRVENEAETVAKIGRLLGKETESVAIYEGIKQYLNAETERGKIEGAASALGAISQFLGEETAAGKAAAIAQATMNTYLAATKALAQGGVFGAIMAAASIAFGLIQVQRIASTNTAAYEEGTDFAPFTGNAFVDEAGPEIHLSRKGKVKSLGKKGGARMTRVERGDKIIPYEQSEEIKKALSTSFVNYPMVEVGNERERFDYERLDKSINKAFKNRPQKQFLMTTKGNLIEITTKGDSVHKKIPISELKHKNSRLR